MTIYSVNRNDYTDTGGNTVKGGRLDDEHTFYYIDGQNQLHFGIPGGGDTVNANSSGWAGGPENPFTGSISGVGTWYGGAFQDGASLSAATVYDVVADTGGSIEADDFADGADAEGGTIEAQTVHGTVTVNGDTSDVTVTDLTNEDGSDSIGLTVSAGKVTVTDVHADTNVQVSAMISGGTTRITNFAIGSKQAAITVLDTGNLTVTTMTFGRNSGDSTIVTVDGSDAVFKYPTATPIGDAGHGEIDLSTAASLNIGKAVLGKSSGGQGYLTATSGSHFDIASLVLGVAGYGSFHLFTASTAKVSGNLTMGQGSTGYGIVDVSGSGSHLTVGGKVLINNENGSSTVAEAGKFDAGSLTIAGRAGTNLGINVSDVHSALAVKGAVVIGQAGSGTLSVTDHAQFTAAGQNIDLGKKAGARGTLTLTDAAKSVGATDLTVGDAGIGTVTLIRGAEQVFKTVTLGAKDGSSGALTVGTASATVGDPASKLHLTGDLTAGVAGIGGAFVYGVATIDGDADLGDVDGGTGYMTVQGKGATATVKHVIALGGQIIGGKAGAGHLNIFGGGHVTTSTGGVAGYTKASSVSVQGKGSKLTADALAMFQGTLDVKDKATLDVKELAVGSLADDADAPNKYFKLFWDSILGRIGQDPDADTRDVSGGKVTISGSGTQVETETIRLAAASRSKSGYGFTISDGAVVTATPTKQDPVGFALDSGSASVDGANSSLAVHGQATLGLAGVGNGDMYVLNHAKLTIDDSLSLVSDTSLGGLELLSVLVVNSGGSVEVGGSRKASANSILVDAGHKISGSGDLHASKIVVSGQIEANQRVGNTGDAESGNLELFGNVQGSGKLLVDPGATLTLDGTDHDVEVAFKGNGGELVLNQPDTFTAALLQLTPGDMIELAGVRVRHASLDVDAGELDVYTRPFGKPAYIFSVQGIHAGDHVDVENDGHGTLLTVVGSNARAGTSAAADDRFVFRPAGNAATATRDVITHFLQGTDRIDLHLLDADTNKSGNQAFTLDAEGTAHSAVSTGHIGWYQENNPGTAHDMTVLTLNVDSDPGIETTIELHGLVALVKADFLL